MPDYEGLTKLGTTFVVEWSAGQDHWWPINHHHFGAKAEHSSPEEARQALETAAESGYFGSSTRDRLRVRKETQEVMDW